jgi:TRAP transporter TAXI family solute receptor
MKKILTICMFALLMFALIGCSSETTSEGSSDSDTDSKTEDTTTDSSTDSTTDSGSESSRPESYQITFPTGTTTGTYYPLGAIFSNFWSEKLDYVQASSQASNGSVQNLIFIKQGEAQLALTPIGTLYEAVNGMSSFEGNKVENVRILAGLYPNVNHLVARKGAGVESIEDIAGKNIVPGATGSATEIESQRTLAAYGVDYEALKKDFVGFTEATDLMRNKQIDAAMVMAGVPTSAVTEMLATADGVLLSYSDEAIAKLQEKYPWTTEYTIAANTYENQPEDVKSVAQFNFLVASADMPDEVAYDLVKTFWENIEELMGSHAVIEQFKLEAATSGTADVALHPGAEKYYKEAGVLK